MGLNAGGEGTGGVKKSRPHKQETDRPPFFLRAQVSGGWGTPESFQGLQSDFSELVASAGNLPAWRSGAGAPACAPGATYRPLGTLPGSGSHVCTKGTTSTRFAPRECVIYAPIRPD